MSEGELDREQLELVARRGSTPFMRTLALVKLANRDDALDDLKEYLTSDDEITASEL